MTRTDKLRETLESKILTGELPPGMRLDEKKLAEEFNVSRTPVREALRQLQAIGLVDIRSRQTPVVSAMTIQKLIQMFEVMAELEGLCARLATRRITIDQCNTLLDTHGRLKEALASGSPVEFYEINRDFHEIIYEAASSDFLAEQTRALRNRVAPYRRHVTYQPGRMASTIEEHQAVIDAIVRGDAESAGTAMRNHVNLLGDNLTDFIARLPQDLMDASVPPTRLPSVKALQKISVTAPRGRSHPKGKQAART